MAGTGGEVIECRQHFSGLPEAIALEPRELSENPCVGQRRDRSLRVLPSDGKFHGDGRSVQDRLPEQHVGQPPRPSATPRL